MKSITIKDIAKELGISVSTVSRALQNHPDISEPTKVLVRDCAKRHNYKPNIMASNLRTCKNTTIGVVLPEVNHHFFSSVLDGIEQTANEAGYNIIICQTGENVEKEIRGMEVSGKVSPIATIGFVREAMVEEQRKLGSGGAVVMDGRDIGTVVYPNAELKIFVTASAEIRAQRRYDEMVAKGDTPNYDDILKNVKERDYIDSHREISPLKQADDAVVLDNSNMTLQEQDEWLMTQFKRATL